MGVWGQLYLSLDQFEDVVEFSSHNQDTLEPNWPLVFEGISPSKTRPNFQSNKGPHLGSRYTD